MSEELLTSGAAQSDVGEALRHHCVTYEPAQEVGRAGRHFDHVHGPHCLAGAETPLRAGLACISRFARSRRADRPTITQLQRTCGSSATDRTQLRDAASPSSRRSGRRTCDWRALGCAPRGSGPSELWGRDSRRDQRSRLGA